MYCVDEYFFSSLVSPALKHRTVETDSERRSRGRLLSILAFDPGSGVRKTTRGRVVRPRGRNGIVDQCSLPKNRWITSVGGNRDYGTLLATAFAPSVS